VLRVLFTIYKALRLLLILAVVAALAAAGWLYFKYRSGERGIREPVKLDLPTAQASYAPTEDDPYYALYGKNPLETDAPTLAPTAKETVEPTARATEGSTATGAEMETIPPAATVAPTFGWAEVPEPTLPPIPKVDEVFAFAEQVTYEGATYTYNDDIVSLLFLGIDDPGKVTVRTEGFGKGNQTDVILLAAIDADKKKVTLLNISRDAMTNVNILSYNHKAIVGSRVMQVALSHAYGDGADLSCLLASDAVAGLVGGLPMTGYVSLNYGALGILNDAVGGVTVTLDEDMTISGKEYKSGDAVAIKGDMAADYIRNRSAGPSCFSS
jgi:hypothetical protein